MPVDTVLECIGLLEEHLIEIVPHAVERSDGSLSRVERQALILANKCDGEGAGAAPLQSLREAFADATVLRRAPGTVPRHCRE